jgi:hypothetical protein
MKPNLFISPIDIPTLILTGLPRSGKSFLVNYIKFLSYNNAININNTIEMIISIYKAGFIEDDLFNYMLTYSIRDHVNEFMIGRRVNIRSDEESSYSNICNEGFKNSFKFNSLLLHSSLSVSNTLIKNIPNSVIINVFSHPINLINAWLEKGYGSSNFYSDHNLNIALPILKTDGNFIPIYAKDFIEKYNNDDEITRVLRMIHYLYNLDNDQFKKNNSDRILMVSYDALLDKNKCAVSCLNDSLSRIFNLSKFNFELNSEILFLDTEKRKQQLLNQNNTFSSNIMPLFSKEAQSLYKRCLMIWEGWQFESVI